jgi:hypothetical protein
MSLQIHAPNLLTDAVLPKPYDVQSGVPSLKCRATAAIEAKHEEKVAYRRILKFRQPNNGPGPHELALAALTAQFGSNPLDADANDAAGALSSISYAKSAITA